MRRTSTELALKAVGFHFTVEVDHLRKKSEESPSLLIYYPKI